MVVVRLYRALATLFGPPQFPLCPLPRCPSPPVACNLLHTPQLTGSSCQAEIFGPVFFVPIDPAPRGGPAGAFPQDFGKLWVWQKERKGGRAGEGRRETQGTRTLDCPGSLWEQAGGGASKGECGCSCTLGRGFVLLSIRVNLFQSASICVNLRIPLSPQPVPYMFWSCALVL